MKVSGNGVSSGTGECNDMRAALDDSSNKLADMVLAAVTPLVTVVSEKMTLLIDDTIDAGIDWDNAVLLSGGALNTTELDKLPATVDRPDSVFLTACRVDFRVSISAAN